MFFSNVVVALLFVDAIIVILLFTIILLDVDTKMQCNSIPASIDKIRMIKK